MAPPSTAGVPVAVVSLLLFIASSRAFSPQSGGIVGKRDRMFLMARGGSFFSSSAARRGTALATASSGSSSSSEPLTQRLASLLIRGPSENDDGGGGDGGPSLSDLASSLSCSPPLSLSAVLAVSGGAVRAPSALATTPGSSSLLRECIFPYDRTSFAEFVSSHPLPPRAILEAPGMAASNGGGKGFAFAGPTAAAMLSNAALHRAMELSGDLSGMIGAEAIADGGERRRCVGVGCSAMLASSSNLEKRSRVHIAVSTADGTTELYEALLSADAEEDRRRDRVEEDEVAGSLLLLAMIKSRYSGEAVTKSARNFADSILNRDGDAMTERVLSVLPYSNGFSDDDGLDPVRWSARRVISGETDAVLLVPSSSSDSDSGSKIGRGGTLTPTPLIHTVLPPDPLIFPGSFNPPHVGHVALANAAVETLARKRREEWEERERRMGFHLAGGSSFMSTVDSGRSSFSESEEARMDDSTWPSPVDSIWSAVEYHARKSPPTVLFEMSLTNPDKPPMDVEEVARRVGLFGRCLDTSDGDMEMPRDWGILLTSSPLFVQKVGMLGTYLCPTRASFDHGGATKEQKRKVTFVIGTDTMVRIIDPKYYGDSYKSMLNAIREMGNAGVHFIVGGRLEQGKAEGEESKFVTGEEELSLLPDDVRGMFTIVQEEVFRLDLSSTELRRSVSQ